MRWPAPGDNACIRAGLAAYLRSEPGPTSGQELVVMQNGEVGRIIGGPIWLSGESDTIRLVVPGTEESRRQGRASANTSELMVLEQGVIELREGQVLYPRPSQLTH